VTVSRPYPVGLNKRHKLTVNFVPGTLLDMTASTWVSIIVSSFETPQFSKERKLYRKKYLKLTAVNPSVIVSD
jgi:hypothetical protein